MRILAGSFLILDGQMLMVATSTGSTGYSLSWRAIGYAPLGKFHHYAYICPQSVWPDQWWFDSSTITLS
jgi:hypothetical protein